jgi:hypothetical protein
MQNARPKAGRVRFHACQSANLLIGSSALTGTFLQAMYKAETITALIAYPSVPKFTPKPA